jgi:hypothetical protein
LERDWQRQLATGTVAEHLRRWRLAEPALAPFSSPSRLISHLRNSPSGERQDAVLAALIHQGREDPVAVRLVLQRLLPGLKRRAARLIIDLADRERVWALLLAHLWEQIRTYPVERRPHGIAARLLLDSIHETLGELAKEREEAASTVPDLPGEPPTRQADDGDVVWLLWRAVHAQAISREEARLILETRIDGISLDAAAAERGLSRHALVVRRVRAEQRLFLNLGWGRVTHRGSNLPLCGARVSGAWSTGLAGGEDQPTPPRR